MNSAEGAIAQGLKNFLAAVPAVLHLPHGTLNNIICAYMDGLVIERVVKDYNVRTDPNGGADCAFQTVSGSGFFYVRLR